MCQSTGTEVKRRALAAVPSRSTVLGARSASHTSVKRLALTLAILRYGAPIRPTALFDGNCKDIADAAFGLDDTWRLRVCLQFAPQPQHLNVDAAIEDVFVEPGCLQQILARKRPLRRIEEGQQQGVLAFAQGNRPFLRHVKAPAATIKPPSAELVSAPLDVAGAQGRSAHTAPQHGG